MTKLKHVALAGITALAFSPIAFAGGSAQQQSSAPGVEQSTIKQAQEKLSSKGHDVSADGVLGPRTQAAVKEFQQKEGIQASGQLDQETLAALGVSEDSAGAGSTSSPSSGSPSEPSATPPAEKDPTTNPAS